MYQGKVKTLSLRLSALSYKAFPSLSPIWIGFLTVSSVLEKTRTIVPQSTHKKAFLHRRVPTVRSHKMASALQDAASGRSWDQVSPS